MIGDHTGNVKRAQKESLFFQEISKLFREAALDDPRLNVLTITRVTLSKDKGTCNIFFYTPDGKDAFHDVFDTLVLYKPSMRAALASRIPGRYTPNLRFQYDAQFEKQLVIENALNKVKTEDQF